MLTTMLRPWDVIQVMALGPIEMFLVAFERKRSKRKEIGMLLKLFEEEEIEGETANGANQTILSSLHRICRSILFFLELWCSL